MYSDIMEALKIILNNEEYICLEMQDSNLYQIEKQFKYKVLICFQKVVII